MRGSEGLSAAWAVVLRLARVAGTGVVARLEAIAALLGIVCLVIAAWSVHETLGLATAGIGLIVIGIEAVIPWKGERP